MTRSLTPRRVAECLGVSESSLKRWCDRGLITAERTPGGHRRLTIDAVIRFVRQTGHQLVRPELLGLPESAGRAAAPIEGSVERLYVALAGGQAEACQQMLLDLFLSGYSLARIFDDVVTPAMVRIGQAWECGGVEVYQERQAVEILLCILHRLELSLPPPAGNASRAQGGTIEGDDYSLPTRMVRLALHEMGWHATCLGNGLPLETMQRAILRGQPRLFWLSVSVPVDESEFAERFLRFLTRVPAGTAVVTGGRGLTAALRRRLCCAACCDNLQQLVSFARVLGEPVGRTD
jgi:excisionase family DNA binding protein